MKKGRDDRLARAIAYVLAGGVYVAVGFSAFSDAAMQQPRIVQFVVGLIFLFAALATLMQRTYVKTITKVALALGGKTESESESDKAQHAGGG